MLTGVNDEIFNDIIVKQINENVNSTSIPEDVNANTFCKQPSALGRKSYVCLTETFKMAHYYMH